MGLIYDNREPQQDSNVLREPLVDIDITGGPPQANGRRPQEPIPSPGSQPKQQRRCLSDVQGKGDEPQASDCTPRKTGPANPRLEIPDVPSHGGLIDLDALPDKQEQPVRPGRPRPMDMETVPEEAKPQPRASRPRPTDDEQVVEEQALRPKPSRPRLANDEPAAEEQEYRPRPSRPRLVISQPQADEIEFEGNGRPRLSNAQPEVEERELRPTPSRPQPASPQPPDDMPEVPAKAHRPRLGQDGRVSAGSSGGTQARLPVDQAKLEQLIGQLRARQNLTLAMLAGLAAAVIGVLAWVVVTTLGSHPIG
jgi:hypothetical protein